MRIAILGISHESLLGSPRKTLMSDMLVYRGQEMMEKDLWLIRGMVSRLRETDDVEICPLIWATALPGGPVSSDAYQSIKAWTLELLRSGGPFDGLCMANHGAMEVDGLACPGDLDFVQSIRKAVGRQVPIAVALDLHGNLDPEFLEAVTVVSALRTAPHRDDKDTGYRTADLLLRILQQGIKPVSAMVRIPMLMPGELAVTHFEPAKSLYAALEDYSRRPGILDANLLIGFAWNDRPWVGMTSVVTCERDHGLARQTAREIAQRVWNARRDFKLSMENASVTSGIADALSTQKFPCYLTDSGDNTTAGAPGDLTTVLREVIKSKARDAVVAGILAPEAFAECRKRGQGATVEIGLGAEHISAPRDPLAVSATVEALGDALLLPGFQPYRTGEGPWVRLRLGGILVTLHQAPVGITTPAHLTGMGIDPIKHSLYVVKLGYLHPQLEDIAARHVLLLSNGVTALDVRKLAWHQIARPIYPLDPDMEWKPS